MNKYLISVALERDFYTNGDNRYVYRNLIYTADKLDQGDLLRFIQKETDGDCISYGILSITKLDS